jgi:xylose isomerase
VRRVPELRVELREAGARPVEPVGKLLVLHRLVLHRRGRPGSSGSARRRVGRTRPSGVLHRGGGGAFAYGITFHDNDLFPFASTPAEGESTSHPSARRSTRPGWPSRCAQQICFPTRCSATADLRTTTATSGASRSARWLTTSTWPPSSARRPSSPGAGEGAESGAAKDVRAALDRYKEAFDLLGQYVLDRGYDMRFAIEPEPNEPRGDILLPTIGHALAFIN